MDSKGAIEPDRPGAVTISQKTPMFGGDAAYGAPERTRAASPMRTKPGSVISARLTTKPHSWWPEVAMAAGWTRRSSRSANHFVHLRHIAEAAVPGYRTMTSWENESSGTPRFCHLYEMVGDDPQGISEQMTPVCVIALMAPPTHDRESPGPIAGGNRDWAQGHVAGINVDIERRS